MSEGTRNEIEQAKAEVAAGDRKSAVVQDPNTDLVYVVERDGDNADEASVTEVPAEVYRAEHADDQHRDPRTYGTAAQS
jgi:hypothetical protein